MKYHLIRHTETNRLIIIFLGWASDFSGFRELRKEGYDILLICDYRDFSATMVTELLQSADMPEYSEIVVIGWSFGVIAAGLTLQSGGLDNVTLRLAVNGSHSHIDNLYGIPENIFNGTLSSLSVNSLRKFQQRVVGSPRLVDGYYEIWSYPTEQQHQKVGELKEELEWFARVKPAAGQRLWDKALIARNDRIFPFANLERAWLGTDCHVDSEGPHMPDFQRILDTFVVDKQRVCRQFSKASDSYSANAIVQQQVARRLMELLPADLSGASSVIELGCGNGTLTALYLPMLGSRSRVVLADVARPDDGLKSIAAASEAETEIVMADCEDAVFSEKYLGEGTHDAVLSSSMLQWLNSPQEMVRRICRALAPRGVAALSFYVEGTLQEISAITGNGLKYPSLPSLRDELGEHPEITVNFAATETHQVMFDSPREALEHLRLTGVNGLSQENSPAVIRALLRSLPRNSEGKYPLTFKVGYLLFSKVG